MLLLELILKYKQIVCGGDGNDVLLWMPGGMQNLFVEIEAVHTDLVLLSFATGAHFAWLQHHFGFDNVTRCLERQFLDGAAVAIKHAEKVVVAAGHDRRVVAVPAALKLIEDTVVLVE